MTPQEYAAIAWVEGLSEQDHAAIFVPAIGAGIDTLAQVKLDHEPGRNCRNCRRALANGTLEVIE